MAAVILIACDLFPVPSASQEQPAAEASQGGADEVRVDGLPGCARAFEICAKFCYNVVAARCAAEHLGMTEDVDKSNLVFKIEVFLNSDVFRSWKDSIIALQSTVALLPWSEELRLVARCVDSIAAKATASPGSVVWSYTYNRKAASSDEIVEARRCSSSSPAVPRDWWVEDLCELDVELYKRVMVAVKSRGDRLPPDVVGEALRAYAARWLPESCRRGDTPADDDDACALEVLETIVWLMPSDGDGSSPCGCSCQFLLNLLKLAVLVGAGELLREELLDRIVLQLHDASVNDLLIPAKPPAQTAYDVDLVEALVGRYTRRAGVDGIDREDVFESRRTWRRTALPCRRCASSSIGTWPRSPPTRTCRFRASSGCRPPCRSRPGHRTMPCTPPLMSSSRCTRIYPRWRRGGSRADGREEAVQGGEHPRGAERPPPAARGCAGALLRADARGGGGERERGAPAGRRRRRQRAPGTGRQRRRRRLLEEPRAGAGAAGATDPVGGPEEADREHEPEAGGRGAPPRRGRRQRRAAAGEERQHREPEQQDVAVVAVAADLRPAVGGREAAGAGRGGEQELRHVRELAEPAVVGQAAGVPKSSGGSSSRNRRYSVS
uniref:Uncharacterized protein n=1 Tax=Hordeum vulgare subsp. vulgare TaxID=112509 RepID=A0A287QTK9_HORVV